MATFDPKQFIENPDATEFKSLNKDKLLALAEHLELFDVKKSIKKSEIKNIVAEKLIEDEIFSEEEILSETDKMLLFKKLELEFQEKEREKERELELRKLEMQERQQALEKEKLELEKLRLKQDSDKFEALEKKFDVTKHIRLVPPFQEKEVDQYFLHFEKVAKNLNWPKENWTMLLQSVLSGKAREIFTQLSVDQASNYDTVKTLILKGYELVPEAYRQKFRNWEKRNDQTYVEFARTKEQLFDRWCNSKKIEENFDKLRQLVLIEEFKRCIHSDVKTYIDEQSADTLDNAARLADDYALTHKVSFSGKPQKSFTNKNPNSSGNFKQNSQAKNKSQSENKTSSDSSTKPKSEPGQTAKSMTCYYCKEPGHMKFDCPLLKNKEQRKITGRTTVNFVSKFGTVSNFVKDVHDTLVKESNSVCKPTEESSSVSGLEEAFGSESFFDLEEFNSNSFCDLEDESNSNSLCTLENEPSPICEQNVGSSTLCGFVKKLNSPCKPNMEGFEPFIHDGFVSLSSDMKDAKPIKYLRDTGALQSVILADVLPFTNETDTGLGALVKGLFEDDYSIAPLHKLYLSTDLVSGHVTMGVRKKMDCDGIQVILGNDLAGKKVFADPIVTENPSLESHVDPIEKEVPGIYPVCAVTRSMSLKLKDKENSNVETSEKNSESFDELPCENKIFSRSEMIAEQQKDPEISKLFSMAVDYDEVSQNPVCYYEKHGVLMRKWRPPDVNSDEDWAIRHQIVVPKSYRSEILKLAHENVLSGHLGINKTYQKVSVHFYWPGIRKDVVEFCRSCHTCQVVGKPNQTPPKAPLKPIPAFEEPFSRIIIDCVGPLPKTKSGNEYLLTIMCASTRFPEAIPLRKINSKNVVKALTKFFTMFGLPKSVQSDQGSNFMSGLFQQVMQELDIKHYSSSAYHPQTQGALERFHQTLKNMIKTYCFDTKRDWDEGIHLLLFAVRESVQESLGFSPFELVFGHSVRGPLKLLKEKILADNNESLNLLQYVSDFRTRLTEASEIAKSNLQSAQKTMKDNYDKKTVKRSFVPGDKVLALLPIPGRPLQARYFGPYVIDKKVSDLNYVLKTPDRRKSKQLCHVNMLKLYIDRNSTIGFVKSVIVNNSDPVQVENDSKDICDVSSDTIKLKNSDILSNLNSKLAHLPAQQQEDVRDLLQQYEHLFGDIPSRTDKLFHDVDIGESSAVKQHPYRLNPEKQRYLESEVQYLLDNDFIEPSISDWSSPCVLVPKPDGSYRMCTDYRKLNCVTKTDTFPIPRIDDCIDKVGNSKFVSKFDLLKGFWQVPLTERAKEISAFVTPQGLYQYKVMPFGMKNSSATFQRLMNMVIRDIEGCDAYIDDVIVYSDTWEDHLHILRKLFDKLTEAKLTINLVKSEFCCAQVTFLGHIVGQGQVKPIDAKVCVISEFPRPTGKKQLMRFLGMIGYYRKFCQNFSFVAEPLTNLLKKRVKFVWNSECENAFNKLKAIMKNAPVLAAPDFNVPFKLAVDASDVAAGAVLLQEGKDGVDHPICYFSKKFNQNQKNYSTIEKECLSLILALQHFEVYVTSSSLPIIVFSDHNPLVFINKLKGKNQRLLRWSIFLQDYNLEIKHIKGKDNIIADCLSRC